MDSAQLPKYPFMFSIAIEFPRVKRVSLVSFWGFHLNLNRYCNANNYWFKNVFYLTANMWLSHVATNSETHEYQYIFELTILMIEQYWSRINFFYLMNMDQQSLNDRLCCTCQTIFKSMHRDWTISYLNIAFISEILKSYL